MKDGERPFHVRGLQNDYSRVQIPTVLDVVYGSSVSSSMLNRLVEEIRALGAKGTAYLAYPVMGSFDMRVVFDAFVLSTTRMPMILSVPETIPASPESPAWEDIAERLFEAEAAIQSKLLGNRDLRERGQLAVSPVGLIYVPEGTRVPDDLEDRVVLEGSLQHAFDNTRPLSEEMYRPLAATIQSVATIKPAKKRVNVSVSNSRGHIIKRIEREIANLDKHQQSAAIECPDQPQRIRGLAGSGKTIVLALKAAYLHAKNPEWHIAVTFHSRALYQQFRDLIRRFTYDQTRDEPDWDHVHILHSWGSRSRPGVYSTIAEHSEALVEDVASARGRFSNDGMFGGICGELLKHVRQVQQGPLFDAVLVDEAQDLPTEFFQLVYEVTKQPKRIVWAFDELQNLTDKASMPPPEVLFGKSHTGAPNVRLQNEDGKPKQDIILPVCYRNPPEALSLAHALGLGVYREGGLTQFFGERPVWEEVGYEVSNGEFKIGSEVVLSRRADSFPAYFKELLTPDDLIVACSFKDSKEQFGWLVEAIKKNIEDDELEADDILVVFANPYAKNNRITAVRSLLESEGIEAEVAGITTSPDEFATRGKVTLANIYRAKGNEATMVYVVDCHTSQSGTELIKKRNALFTAITRAKAWLRLLGIGEPMDKLIAEVENARGEDFGLKFVVPTAKERKHLRNVHRELSPQEKKKQKKARDAAQMLTSMNLDDLPPELISALREKLSGE